MNLPGYCACSGVPCVVPRGPSTTAIRSEPRVGAPRDSLDTAAPRRRGGRLVLDLMLGRDFVLPLRLAASWFERGGAAPQAERVRT